jgi:hypothetical protein
MKECIRRNRLLPVIEAAMADPAIVPGPLWPVALIVCSPRDKKVGPILVHALVRKMIEVNGFDHTAAVYRFEKARATKLIRKWSRRVRACIRLQCWWRQYHLETAIVFVSFDSASMTSLLCF